MFRVVVSVRERRGGRSERRGRIRIGMKRRERYGNGKERVERNEKEEKREERNKGRIWKKTEH